MPVRRIVISGCSGGGKSTITDGLASKGFMTVPEAGRIIVRQEMATNGRALPWVDRQMFVEKLATLAGKQFQSAADLDGPIFFDRSVIEPIVYSTMQGLGLSDLHKQAAQRCRYENPIFMVPPWEEIFTKDQERLHSFVDATKEYDALYQAFIGLSYDVCVVPQLPVDARIEFILKVINS